MSGELSDAQIRDVTDLFLLHKAGGLDAAEYEGAREAATGPSCGAACSGAAPANGSFGGNSSFGSSFGADPSARVSAQPKKLKGAGGPDGRPRGGSKVRQDDEIRRGTSLPVRDGAPVGPVDTHPPYWTMWVGGVSPTQSEVEAFMPEFKDIIDVEEDDFEAECAWFTFQDDLSTQVRALPSPDPGCLIFTGMRKQMDLSDDAAPMSGLGAADGGGGQKMVAHARPGVWAERVMLDGDLLSPEFGKAVQRRLGDRGVPMQIPGATWVCVPFLRQGMLQFMDYRRKEIKEIRKWKKAWADRNFCRSPPCQGFEANMFNPSFCMHCQKFEQDYAVKYFKEKYGIEVDFAGKLPGITEMWRKWVEEGRGDGPGKRTAYKPGQKMP